MQSIYQKISTPTLVLAGIFAGTLITYFAMTSDSSTKPLTNPLVGGIYTYEKGNDRSIVEFYPDSLHYMGTENNVIELRRAKYVWWGQNDTTYLVLTDRRELWGFIMKDSGFVSTETNKFYKREEK